MSNSKISKKFSSGLRSRNKLKMAVNRFKKGLMYSSAHRRKNRVFHSYNFVKSLNNFQVLKNFKYSSLMKKLSSNNILLDRKSLSLLSTNNHYVYDRLMSVI